MEFREVVRTRRMVRSFLPDPVDPSLLDRLLSDALRSPSAGNSQGREFVVLRGPEETARFWDITLPSERRDGFAWPGLLLAPVIIVPLADASRYLERYAEPDKAKSGLGESEAVWPVPYWTVDTSFAVMTLLHGVVDAGLGALFFGIFRNEAELMERLGVPDHLAPVGAVALGHPAPGLERPGRSAGRDRRPLAEVVHYGVWGGSRSS
jgi:nitroreductase